MRGDLNYVHLIDESIKKSFESASRIALRDPSQTYFLLKPSGGKERRRG